MLRHWQSECINLALNKYLHGKQLFLTQATPGAGKTFMAASLSKKMFDAFRTNLELRRFPAS